MEARPAIGGRPATALAERQPRLFIAAFSATLFLSALLLFSVQPLFARMVLPRLGGTPAVWSVAMVFFQAMLLAGYAYAHLLSRWPMRRALLLHAAVMLAGLLWLPLGIAEDFGRPPESGVALWLLALFAASVGVPFFAVAANAPLLQAWFARTGHPDAEDPYFLYGASNLGSMAALLSYPVLIEPLLGLREQAGAWTAGFVLLIATVAICGLLAAAEPGKRSVPAHPDRPREPVSWVRRLQWLGLAFIPAGLLVAVTAHLSMNIAAAPFLWVLPLGLYLLTFVLAFRRRPLLPRAIVQALLPAAVGMAVLVLAEPNVIGKLGNIGLHLAAFFLITLVCHTELFARRPEAGRLTEFYLGMSAGGVLGGAFPSLLAPLLFDSILEYPLLLGASTFAVPQMWLLLRRPWMPVLLAAAAAVAILRLPAAEDQFRERSFFGIVRVKPSSDGRHRLLVHGTTLHGAQRLAELAPGIRPEPLTYYTAEGPIASAIRLRRQNAGGPLSVGLVGLGTGSLACFREEGDRWRFYELDAAVVRVARDSGYFTFLSACGPDVPIILGDARLTLAEEPDASFDVLVVDAFSSDAVPVHLMTREALRLYMRKLRPGGIAVLHISNRFMALAGVASATAAAEGLANAELLQQRTKEEQDAMRLPSDVVVVAADPESLRPFVAAGWKPGPDSTVVRPWTDDYSNVIAAILRHEGLL